jgi:ribosomal protein S18 acetylase RimI-like enzyme
METVERVVDVNQAQSFLSGLIALLQNIVHTGSSVGFMPPLSEATAREYWLHLFDEVARGERALLVVTEADRVIGSAQIAFSDKQNGLHRAAVEKILVHPEYRLRGIASRLMTELETVAREAKRTLLVLDTEEGSGAENLYLRCGYTALGTIPNYALNADGSLRGTVVFYKLL